MNPVVLVLKMHYTLLPCIVQVITYKHFQYCFYHHLFQHCSYILSTIHHQDHCTSTHYQSWTSIWKDWNQCITIHYILLQGSYELNQNYQHQELPPFIFEIAINKAMWFSFCCFVVRVRYVESQLPIKLFSFKKVILASSSSVHCLLPCALPLLF